MDTSAIQSHSVSDESWDWLFSSWNISSANTALALTDEWECFVYHTVQTTKSAITRWSVTDLSEMVSLFVLYQIQSLIM